MIFCDVRVVVAGIFFILCIQLCIFLYIRCESCPFLLWYNMVHDACMRVKNNSLATYFFLFLFCNVRIGNVNCLRSMK